MDQSPWHVLHVTSNHEKKVAQHLSARDLEHYLPLYTEHSRWSDRTVVLERPLFTGYVFVRLSPESRYSVISVPGVIRLLGNGPTNTVGSEELERIRSGLASGCLLLPHRSVGIGTPVRVRNGIFQGVRGVITEMRRRCRVIIELAAVKQSFSLEVDWRDVDVLAKGSPNPSGAPSVVSTSF